jgi:hypothetical protein
MMAIGAFAASFPGFSKWAFACDHELPPAPERRAHYSPQFFTPEEYAAIERLTEIIIPSDGTPGAREAGVAEFVDFYVGSDAALQPEMRTGLMWLEKHARQSYSREFLELSPEQQTAILEPLAYKAKFRPDEEAGQKFFKLIRQVTVMGFYTTRIGLEQLDYPGLRFYSQSPACPHVNDREHRHLPPPK